MEAKKTINIENYFTEENSKKGVWHEAVIDGVACGLEFLLVGIDGETKKLDEIDKRGDEIRNSDKKDEEKLQLLTELDAERVAVLTKGLRRKDGAELLKNGKPVEFSTELVKELYLKCPSLKIHNIEFVLKDSNFMILE